MPSGDSAGRPTAQVAQSTAQVRPAVIEPLSPARYEVQFTASQELCDMLERLRALMRSEVPDGDLAAIVERAVSEKLQRLEARRFKLLCEQHNRYLAEVDYGKAAVLAKVVESRRRRTEPRLPAAPGATRSGTS